MKGNMTKIGLTTNMLISHAEINHSQTEVISVDVKGNVEKSTCLLYTSPSPRD